MEIDEKKLKEILSEVYSNKKPIDQKIKEEIKNYLSSQERQLPEVEFDLIKKQTRKYNIAIVFLTALSGDSNFSNHLYILCWTRNKL
jgi:hypothetical protein